MVLLPNIYNLLAPFPLLAAQERSSGDGGQTEPRVPSNSRQKQGEFPVARIYKTKAAEKCFDLGKQWEKTYENAFHDRLH